MSDIKKNLQEDMDRAALLEKKIAELREDEIEIRRHKADIQKTKISEAQRNKEIMDNMSFGSMTADEVKETQKLSDEYIEAAQHSQIFINAATFKGVVPMFRKNLIFIGAKTGEGKSTAIANMVHQLIAQLNPITKRRKRVLVITNEERKEDFFNRITCLIHGWHYVNHDKFTPQQKATFNKYIDLLSSLVTVIDDSHRGAKGVTTTPEGIAMVFEGCLRENEIYDAVLIDYYQNVTYSQVDLQMNPYQAQEKLANLLDHYKNEYPAPIVIMGQITPAKEGEETEKPFEFRIKGRKQILVPATFAMEMVAERGMLRTAWIIHKGRFSEDVGKTLYTGYDKGRFVEYSPEFKLNAMRLIEQRNNQAMNRRAGTNFMDTPKNDKPLAAVVDLVPKENKDAEIQKETSSDRSTPTDSGQPPGTGELVQGIDKGDETPT